MNVLLPQEVKVGSEKEGMKKLQQSIWQALR
jgi:hypothetical protein